MIKDKYLSQVSKIVNKFIKGADVKVFLFGSSVSKKRFGDLDLGVSGKVSDEEISQLKEELKNSTLPYNVDVINFNKVSEEFKNNIFNNKIIWIKR